MPDAPKYDVSVKIGLLFILGCGAMAAVIGILLPLVADQVGLLYLGKTAQGLHHAGVREAAFFGLGACLIGLVNGVVLSTNRNRWWISLLVGTVPCGLFGGITAWTAPRGLSQVGNVLVFLMVPLLVSAACVVIRREVWNRYEKPVKGDLPKPSPSVPKNTKSKKKK